MIDKWNAKLLVLTLLLAVQSNCVPISVRHACSVMDQQATAVKIITICDSKYNLPDKLASGVMVSKNRALTAYHVVSCLNLDGTPIRERNKVILVFVGDVKYTARVINYDKYNDLAQIELDTADARGPVALSRPRRPYIDDKICMAARFPEPVRICGSVLTSGDFRIDYDMLTLPGNSGAGVYDSSGDLVGITIERCFFIADKRSCGGVAASLVSAVDSWKVFAD